MLLSSSIVRLGVLGLAFGVAAAGGSSCNCEPPPVTPDGGTPTPPSIAFGVLPNGTVHCADDVDPNTDGVQVDITVVVSNNDGSVTSVTVTNDQGGSFDGSVGDDDTATVRVTLVGSENGTDNVLSAVTNTGVEADETGTVTSDCVVSGVFNPTCAITEPAAGSTLNGASTNLVVTTDDGATAGTSDQETLVAAGTISCTADNGTAAQTGTVQLTGNTGDTTLNLPGDGPTTITCTLVDADNLIDHAVTCSVDVDVVNETPGLVVVSPTEGQTVGPDDDVSDGVSVPLVGTTVANNPASYTVECDNLSIPATPITLEDNLDGTFDFHETIDGLVDGACTLTVHVDGVEPDVVVHFTVDAGIPVVAIEADADADADGFYETADDTVPATSDLDIGVTLTGDNLDPNETWHVVFISINDEDGNNITPLPADVDLGDGSQPATTTVTLPPGEHTYTVTVSAHNADNTITTTPTTTTIRVDTVAPDVIPQSPSSDGQTFNAAADADLTTDGLQVRLVLAVSADTTSCVVTVDGTPHNGVADNGLCQVILTLDDGTHSVSATATDAAGNTSDVVGPVSFATDGSIPTITNLVCVKAGADNVLNIADNGGVATSGNVTCDFTATVSADLNGRTLRIGTVSATASGGTATFVGVALPQGDTTVTASGSDIGGNAASQAITVTVDTVAPTAVIDAPPSGTTLLAVDDEDPGTAGMQHSVSVSSDAEGQTVTLAGVTGTTTGVVSGGGVTIVATFPEGGTSVTATVSDVHGNATTSTAVAVTTDSTVPSLVIAAPLTVTPGDDVDLVTPGVQVDLSVTPTGLGAGRTITITSDVQGDIGTCASGADGVAVACRVTFLQSDTHVLTAAATEASGNPATSNSVSVDVATGFFFVSLNNPPLRAGFRSVGAAEDGDNNAGNGAQVTITGTTDAPNGATVQVLVGGVPVVATCTVNNSALSCTAITLQEAQSGQSFEVTVLSGVQTGTSGESTLSVDLGKPTTNITNPAAASVTFKKSDDLAAGVAGLQVNISVAVTECENGKLQILDGATALRVQVCPAGHTCGTNSVNIGASGNDTVTVQVTDLNEGDAETWTATCVDADANAPVTPDSFAAKVDFTAPTCGALTLTTTDLRRGILHAAYAQPGDTGATGTATTVELAFSKAGAVTDANFGTTGQIVVAGPAGAGGTAESFDTPPSFAFDNTWNAGLRATDDVGNVCTISTASVTLTTTETDLTAPVGATGWAQSLSTPGDINNDGFDDIVVGAPGPHFGGDPGGFEVILGAATADAVTRTFVPAPASMACVAPPCNPVEIGWNVNIVRSLNGDAFDDVLAVGYDQRFTPEFVLIYAGGPSGVLANQQPASVLEWQDGTQFVEAGFQAQSVGDVDNDGDIDWIIPAPLNGEVYLFLNTGSFPASGTIAQRATTRIFDPDFIANGFGNSAAGTTNAGGDAFDDIVISVSNVPALDVVHGRGTWPAEIDVSANGAVDRIAVADDPARLPGIQLLPLDIDGSGTLDVAAVSTSDVAILTNTAGVLGNTLVPFMGVNFNFPFFYVGAADFNLDGKDDLVGGGGATDLRVFFGASPFTLPSSNAPSIDYPGTQEPAIDQTLLCQGANLIGDATTGPDIVCADSSAGGRLLIRH